MNRQYAFINSELLVCKFNYDLIKQYCTDGKQHMKPLKEKYSNIQMFTNPILLTRHFSTLQWSCCSHNFCKHIFFRQYQKL